MDKVSKTGLFLILLILPPVLISGCSSLPSPPSVSLPSLPLSNVSIPFPSLQSIPFIGDLVKKLPFFPHGNGSPLTNNESVANVNETNGGKSKTEIEIPLKKRGESGINEREVEKNETAKPIQVPKERISRMSIHPVFAEFNRSRGWSVIFQLEFLTNVKEEKGDWQLFLYSPERLIDKRKIDTVDVGIKNEFQGFRINYAVNHVREGEVYRIKAIREIELLQPGGSAVASYDIRKEIDVNFDSKVKFIKSEISCGEVDYSVKFTGLIPAKLSVNIRFPSESFSKTFRIVGGERYNINFDSNLNRSIFKVRNGESEINLNFEKYLRIASTPESDAEIVLKSDNPSEILSTIKFDRPNVSVKAEAGEIVIENRNGSLPIYIDSIVLVDANAKTIPVGRLLCNKIEIGEYNGYHGKLLVIGGPNLFWSDYRERYITKKPKYILFDGNI